MAIDLSSLSAREAITAIYIGYYDRAADPVGIDFWEDVIDMTSLDLVAITTDFAGQDETLALYPFFASPETNSASAFITQVYLNLFNREPDAAGLAFWTEQLEAAVAGEEGALSVGQIITSIIEGAQSLDEGGFPDEETLLNKIDVALDWTAAAEDSDIDYSTNSAAQASAKAILDNVDETAASVAAAMAETDVFFAEDGNNGGQPGVEIRMTDGVDNIVVGDGSDDSTTGADLIRAETGELNSGDFIDSGSGRDALVIFNEEDGVAVSPRTVNLESVYFTNQANDLVSVADNNVGGYNYNPLQSLFGVDPGDEDLEDLIEEFVLADAGDFRDGNFLATTDVFGFDPTVMVDVEIDGGRMVGVDRWEDFDSRADLVIEDARDDDDTDGTFTGDLTVAMVSTDPGNVDFAVYFDGPVNTSANDDAIFIEVIDQNNSSAFSASAITASTEGNLTDAQLTTFSILVDGNRIDVDLDTDVVGTAHFGANATYTDLLNAINTALDNTTLPDGSIAGDDITATLGGTFDENIGDDNAGEATNSDVFGLQIVLRSASGAELGDAGAGDITVISREDPADTAQAITNQENIIEELIRLNVELDDVGKGSMGGDALFGAMSTGRQDGDDGTSDSIGIQQFDIKVDRSSQLQTINSTNNALQVVNIVNGENSGINNTETAAGDLTVRGAANPGVVFVSNGVDGSDDDPFDLGEFFGSDFEDIYVAGNGPNSISTDDPMPGGVPQHNAYGFSDVRVIDGSTMIGALDITAELTEEVVEKYMQIQDGQSNGEADDVGFNYTMGLNDDEFFLNMSADALDSAGTGSREDFDMTLLGNAGDDVLTTNVGFSLKLIDEQGQDHYIMVTDNDEGWYQNSVFTNAATFTVSGGSGDDTIWTHGWGDSVISDGSGLDAVYTDNSGVVQSRVLATNIDRNLLEHDPIDYVVGAVWALNAETTDGSDDVERIENLSGATNEFIPLIAAGGITSSTLNNGQAIITVSFTTAGNDLDGTDGSDDGVYTTTAAIPVSELVVSGGSIGVTEQTLNQAIKAAVNSDQTLSQLLEAADGPGNALIVASKIDGDYNGAEFGVEFSSITVNGTTTGLSLTPSGYVSDSDDLTDDGDIEFASLSSDSEAESDNIINVSADGDNDVFVLSSNDDNGSIRPIVDSSDDTVDFATADLNGASNETLRIADGNFGSDTVLNFDEGDDNGDVDGAEDVFDFLAINHVSGVDVFSQGAFSATDDSISIVEETAGNDTADEVADFYDGMAATGTAEAIAIVYDSADDNRGNVYLVTDTATGTATAELIGDIELVGTDWDNLTAENFA